MKIKKIDRIKSSQDFKFIYNNGKSVVNRDLVLYFLENNLDKIRLGVSVSRKIGKAVLRNRVKRLIKESVYKNKEKIKEGYDIIIIARRAISEKSFHEVEKTFIDIISKAGLKNENFSN